MLQVSQTTIDEIKDLVASGDVKLEERRAVFRKAQERETTLPDHKLLVAVAATEDDDDTEFVTHVLEVEEDDFQIIADDEASAA